MRKNEKQILLLLFLCFTFFVNAQKILLTSQLKHTYSAQDKIQLSIKNLSNRKIGFHVVCEMFQNAKWVDSDINLLHPMQKLVAVYSLAPNSERRITIDLSKSFGELLKDPANEIDLTNYKYRIRIDYGTSGVDDIIKGINMKKIYSTAFTIQK
ncbi:hypothetical protein A9P82_02395 [Arachidicoccus ginsenosidimutans]|uniref:hypothetical protein n=1 Tax=Arachidicoccus sp. BS20 TaxID=1850526 RepID=UPI0007F0E805|nr:hypothetical protein [Arachidicoccus sp. BS20]ANI88252.1 hypothetical protein A9P82_02395 [Arachidicoccus sp. BS20]